VTPWNRVVFHQLCLPGVVVAVTAKIISCGTRPTGTVFLHDVADARWWGAILDGSPQSADRANSKPGSKLTERSSSSIAVPRVHSHPIGGLAVIAQGGTTVREHALRPTTVGRWGNRQRCVPDGNINNFYGGARPRPPLRDHLRMVGGTSVDLGQ
jgi:hypothetical protein